MLSKKVTEKLNDLSEEELYSTILFALFNLKNEPSYAALSELVFLMDNKSLMNLLKFYGGQTIKIPTVEEFKTVVNALVLFMNVNLKGLTMNESIKLQNLSEFEKSNMLKVYSTISEILIKYDFRKSN